MFWPYIKHILLFLYRYITIPAGVWKFIFRDSRMKKKKERT